MVLTSRKPEIVFLLRKFKRVMYIFRKNTEGHKSQKSKPGRNGREKIYALKSRNVHRHTRFSSWASASLGFATAPTLRQDNNPHTIMSLPSYKIIKYFLHQRKIKLCSVKI